MGTRRASLNAVQRAEILKKTAGTCHVCGCSVKGERWNADHVIPHAHGGSSDLDNYLPICGECNRLRWFFKPEELRRILRLGVYANKEIQKGTPLGAQLEVMLARRLAGNAKRRVKS